MMASWMSCYQIETKTCTLKTLNVKAKGNTGMLSRVTGVSVALFCAET